MSDVHNIADRLSYACTDLGFMQEVLKYDRIEKGRSEYEDEPSKLDAFKHALQGMLDA